MNHVKYGESKRFYLEGVERSFEGWDTGHRWNGWAMPLVTPETRDAMLDEMRLDVEIAQAFSNGDAEWVETVCQIKLEEPDKDGLIGLNHGWCFWWDGE